MIDFLLVRVGISCVRSISDGYKASWLYLLSNARTAYPRNFGILSW